MFNVRKPVDMIINISSISLTYPSWMLFGGIRAIPGNHLLFVGLTQEVFME